MKKLVAFVVLVCSISAQTVFAQTRTEETRTTTDSTGKTVTEKIVTVAKVEDIRPLNNMIIINPLKFILYYNLSYYRKISPLADIGIGFQIPSLSEIKGWGVNAEIRLHPSLHSPRGFYFAPNFSYNSISTESSSGYYDSQGNYIYSAVTTTASATSVGGLVGWQWFPGDEFAIGLGIGVDYYFLSAENRKNSFGRFEGTAPALRFDIGYAW
jgi:hypothetical protein